VEHAIVIRDEPSDPRPASTPTPPAERILSLTELAGSLASLGIMITSDPAHTAESFLSALRAVDITSEMLSSPPTVIPSTTGPDQFAFYPGSLRHATALFHALQDVASTGVSYVSLVPGPDGLRYELQQSALIPTAFVSLFPESPSGYDSYR
jgi:hypothetical protein